MKYTFENGYLKVTLSFWESFFTFSFRKTLSIPLLSIKKVHDQRPQTSWREIRAPGTFIPRVIKAGTYFTPRGKEFWYNTKKENAIVIEFKNESKYKNFSRFILESENKTELIKKINKMKKR